MPCFLAFADIGTGSRSTAARRVRCSCRSARCAACHFSTTLCIAPPSAEPPPIMPWMPCFAMKSSARSVPPWIGCQHSTGKRLRPRHQCQFLQRIAAIRHLGRQRVVLALVRERLVVEGLEDDIDLFLEQFAVGRPGRSAASRTFRPRACGSRGRRRTRRGRWSGCRPPRKSSARRSGCHIGVMLKPVWNFRLLREVGQMQRHQEMLGRHSVPSRWKWCSAIQNAS